MNITHIITSDILANLANRFDEDWTLGISHETSDFDDTDIRFLCLSFNSSLDFVRDMRDNLYCFTEIITSAFIFDNREIDFSSGRI